MNIRPVQSPNVFAIIFDTLYNMTDKKIELIRRKIKKYKKTLAADKKYWGGQYHDSGGIRYLIPGQFIKIKDYKGGLKYLKWFDKNFPDDISHPIFLFEWTVILFKCGKQNQAEQKAHRTFFSNTYLFDKFLEKEPQHPSKGENSSWELASFAESFNYSSRDTEFIGFANWVETILRSSFFPDNAKVLVEVERKLKNEPVGQRRSELVEKAPKIKNG